MNTDTLIRDEDGDLFIGQSRIMLQNIITARQRGETPERIRENFPSLSLAHVHDAIVYYLEHQAELDARFAEDQRTLDQLRVVNHATNAAFFDAVHARFESARGQR